MMNNFNKPPNIAEMMDKVFLTNAIVQQKFLLEILINIIVESKLATMNEINQKFSMYVAEFEAAAAKREEDAKAEAKVAKDAAMKHYLENMKPAGEA